MAKFIEHGEQDRPYQKIERTSSIFIETFKPFKIENIGEDLPASKIALYSYIDNKVFTWTEMELKKWVRENDPWIWMNTKNFIVFREAIVIDARLTTESEMSRKIDSYFRNIKINNTVLKISKHGFESDKNLPYIFKFNRTWNTQLLKPENQCQEIKLFNKWLQKALNTKEKRTLFYEMIGDVILPKAPLETFYFLSGSGLNGKSFIMDELVRRVIGEEYYTTFDLGELTGGSGRFESSSFAYKLCAWDDDAKKLKVAPLDKIKKLSSAPTLRIEKKGKDRYEERNSAKMVMSVNTMPTFNESTYGLERRLGLLHFSHTFKESEKLDPIVFENEDLLDYVFMKAILHVHEAMKRGGITQTKEAKEYIEANKELNNPIEVYLRDNPIIYYNDGIRNEYFVDRELITKINPKILYKQYCEDLQTGHKPSATHFYKEIERIYNAVKLTGSVGRTKCMLSGELTRPFSLLEEN